MKLHVTDTKTGLIWCEENHPHSWTNLCLFIMKRYPDFHLIYCDIECLAKGNTWGEYQEVIPQWYMLDECGRYEPLPDEFIVEEMKE